MALLQTPPSLSSLGVASSSSLRRALLPSLAFPTRAKCVSRPISSKYLRPDYLVTKVSAKEVQEMVKGDRDVPLIVDFYATWCGPCILMAQELELLAVEYENTAKIVKVDTDEEYEFARDMQVRGLPTLYIFSPDPSKDAIRTEGLIPTQMIRDIIDNEISVSKMVCQSLGASQSVVPAGILKANFLDVGKFWVERIFLSVFNLQAVVTMQCLFMTWRRSSCLSWSLQLSDTNPYSASRCYKPP
ncbi:hypothetical protein H6P81_020247 [Aristolochia fimbriata]|uniref:Thioredoxin domain-containing protein n=1 Tax=Aristolochia fimbriata TaxID=158543 RepID=A0AAV7DXZ9_ARIFI|nr:hypothetical protein H6P81_020247 [Aristolochia fimbriata]